MKGESVSFRSLMVLFTLISVVFRSSRLLLSSQEKPTVRYLLSTQQQTDNVSDKLENLVENLSATEPDISHRKKRTGLKEEWMLDVKVSPNWW